MEKNKHSRSLSITRKVHKHGTSVSDDGTTTFFYRAHTTIILFITIGCLAYVTFFEDPTVHEQDWEYNTKRGLIAACLCFLAFGITQAKDGPFQRPHPALWRLSLCCSVIYFLFCVVLLFQSATNARQLMRYFDKKTGKPLNYTAYGHDCNIYDPVNFPDDPFHNLWLKMDGFVTAHFVGWVCKMLMLRDFWITNVISLLFEFLEYSLEHQLANFSECWWDHWILDFIICNGGGIIVGWWMMRYFKNKTYDWRGLCNQSSAKDKMTRMVAQFSPYSWVSFQWNMTKSLKNWFYVNLVVFVYLLSELNTFYLKAVLWIPAGHWTVLTRLWFLVFWGAPATREFYDYMVGHTQTIGQQFWVYSAICFTETMIVFKFGKDIITKPFPSFIKLCWGWFFAIYLLWSLWKFQVHYKTVRPGTEEAIEAEQCGDIDPRAQLPRVEVLSNQSKSSSDDFDKKTDINMNLRKRRTKKVAME